MRSVGCGVLDVGRGEGAVGGRVGGVDGRSVGSAAAITTTANMATPAVKCAILSLSVIGRLMPISTGMGHQTRFASQSVCQSSQFEKYRPRRGYPGSRCEFVASVL